MWIVSTYFIQPMYDFPSLSSVKGKQNNVFFYKKLSNIEMHI